MNKIKKRILTVASTCILAVGMFPLSAFAEEENQVSADLVLQYEQQSTFSLMIPSVLDITCGNCIGVQDANISEDKEIYVRVRSNSFNDNNGITMTNIKNADNTINVSLQDSAGKAITAENNLLCVITTGESYGTFFQGVCDASGVQAGKYRGTIYIDAGIRDRTVTQ